MANIGTVLIAFSIILAITGDYRFQLAGVILAVIAIGLRIEAAIRDGNVQRGTKDRS